MKRSISLLKGLLCRDGKDKSPINVSEKWTNGTITNGNSAPAVEMTPESSPVFTRGERNDNSYTSAFLGLRFDLPEGWVFGTDQKLIERSGLNPDEIDGEILNDSEELAALFAQQKVFLDMVAGNQDGTALIQLSLQNLTTVGTVAEHADALVEVLRDPDNYYVPYVVGDLEQQELAGRTFTVIPSVLEEYGFYQYVYLTQVGNYLLTINISGMDSSVRDYADCFIQF